jgi:ATP-dependent helicase HrpA
MTDGILLAETQSDPYLNAYDTIIIDEAHERSLNIDFLLGYLKQLLPKRPDLKVIITSATIDAERFSQHFSGAPVIEVSGRSIRSMCVTGRSPIWKEKTTSAICTTRLPMPSMNWLRLGPGDILVFLPGEREIREAAEALRKHHPAAYRNSAAVCAAVGRRSGPHLQALGRRGASCWRPTSPKPRSPCRASAT